ncbi:cupin domain-containing protein [Paraburkholderia bryophila]|uniref:helix-turn-helix domain-containing protein n=1 Tax=Paraburkholderia bryophila TaxID=420952 RepID=UPI00234B5E10|nr:cupin domain-containing protein [Paraburkholderia bryophila]WCM22239.1 cupin domain-containing protein [Paraburkholderia bryophila]
MDSDIMHIGQRIRRLRREARLTLLEVASAANLSIGFMSQVERNLTGISISSLVNVAKALNVPLGVLVDQPRQEQPDSHQGARESYSLDDTQQRYERLSTTFNGSLLNAVKVQLLEGYRSEWVAHGGDEFVYVLSGQVSYAVGKKEYLLASGDSLHFDAQQQHRVTNLGDGVAELISVGTLQLFDDDHSVFVSLANSAKPVRAGKVAAKAGKVARKVGTKVAAKVATKTRAGK